VHFMRTLPTGSVDPNFGRRVRNRRQLNSLQNTWPYGYSMPIAVRYTQDAFSRSGWLWPVDAKGEPLKATSYMAVGFYVAKIGRAVQQECRDRKSGSAGMPRPTSYAVFCLKKKRIGGANVGAGGEGQAGKTRSLERDDCPVRGGNRADAVAEARGGGRGSPPLR